MESQREKILRFVTENGASTTAQIKEAFNIRIDGIGNVLNKLKRDGLVEKEKVPGKAAVWSATGSLDEVRGGPVRIHKAKWERGHARDPLVAALFGAA